MNSRGKYLFQEGRYYALREFEEILGNSAKAKRMLWKLQRSNIIHSRKPYYSSEDSIEIKKEDIALGDPDDRFTYVFDFVGVIEYCDDEKSPDGQTSIIWCYPKYMTHEPSPGDMKIVMRALSKHNPAQFFVSASVASDTEFVYNPLALCFILLNDFFSNGLYTNPKNEQQINGDGEIDWNETIDRIIPVLYKGKPFYLDQVTNQTQDDLNSYITRLHQYLLTYASNYLEDTGLAALLGIELVKLYDGSREDFGEIDYIKQNVLQEISRQFITQKQMVLRAMYAILSNDAFSQMESPLSFYGTSSFHVTWEKACSYVFSSVLEKTPAELSLAVPQKMQGKTFKDIIPYPEWYPVNSDNPHYAQGTLIPDFVCCFGDFFAILDAKYYRIIFNEKTLLGYPGVGDIDKQYLYQLAFQPIIDMNKMSVVNAFMFPGDSVAPKLLGSVSMPVFHYGDIGNRLVPIKAVQIPANKILNLYVSGQHINLQDFIPGLFTNGGDNKSVMATVTSGI